MSSDGRLVYRIADLAGSYFEHFAYTHNGSNSLTVEWDDSVLDASLFYRFNESEVAENGVTFISLDGGKLTQHPIRWPEWYAAEHYRSCAFRRSRAG